MAGVKDAEGNMSQSKPSPQEMEGVGGYETTRRLITADAGDMAARAKYDEDHLAPYVDDYLDVLARNTYVRYRNGFLLAFLDGLLRHPEQDWTLKRARRVSAATLAGNKLEFEQGLALAIQAIRAKAKARGADAALDATIDRIRSQASQAMYPNGDPWSMHLRNLAALSECLAGTDQHRDVASQCLTDAAHLWRGYAGFRAPACLTLAEAVRVTGSSALGLSRQCAAFSVGGRPPCPGSDLLRPNNLSRQRYAATVEDHSCAGCQGAHRAFQR